MIQVNIHEAKANLSRYIDAARRGERVVVCKRNVPAVELVAIEEPRRVGRRVGYDRGRVSIPDSFFDPLPDWLLDAFEGRED